MQAHFMHENLLTETLTIQIKMVCNWEVLRTWFNINYCLCKLDTPLLTLQSSHKCLAACADLRLQLQPFINELSTVMVSRPMTANPDWERIFFARNIGPTRWEDRFLNLHSRKGGKWPTECQPRYFHSWTVLLSFWQTNPPLLCLLTQNISPNWHRNQAESFMTPVGSFIH